ncbi:hypothetical protein BB561_004921 [Smittium simulii]|uniref:Condensin complex subunit 1 n=1 Tax=Smittium simulii TaxID=133385 RepID=A0A2T9YDC4_9FUNG|nr:hypothetical protein BB561_004921 [Smittium simulii]
MYKLQEKINDLYEDPDACLNLDELSFSEAKNIIEGFQDEANNLNYANSENQDFYFDKNNIISRYTILLQLLIEQLCKPSKHEVTLKKKISSKRDHSNLLGNQITGIIKKLEEILKTITKITRLNLNRIWETNTEKDSFLLCLSKIPSRLIETVDFAMNEYIRNESIETLLELSLNPSYKFTLANNLWQNLRNYEHMCDIVVEIVFKGFEKYENIHLGDELLKFVSTEPWADSSDKSAQKYIAKFLTSLSLKAPKMITRFMNQLVNLLDNESYIVRASIIEVLGHLIVYSGSLEQNEQLRNQIVEYFDIIEQRFLDSHYIVRGRVLQICQQICMGPAKFPKQRPRLIELTISRLHDKASNVRRNAIKSLMVFLETHPFNLNGGELLLSELESRLYQISNNLQIIVEKAKKELQNEQTIPNNDNLLDSVNLKLNSENETLEKDKKLVIRYKLEIQYYQDAIHFIKQMENATDLTVRLLLSTNKQEVIESIKFILLSSRYKIAGSQQAIRKLLHLVWQPNYVNTNITTNQDNPTMEFKVIQTLYDAFTQLYISRLDNLSDKENIANICNNLLRLVDNASLSDLASLEKILNVLMKTNSISLAVISKLISMFSKSSKERRGSILLLSMISSASKNVVGDNIEIFLNVGLGKVGFSDFFVSKYTCIALKSLFKFNNNQPSILSSEIIKTVTKATLVNNGEMFGSEADFKLSQLLFIIGHVAIKEVELLEVIEADLKKRKTEEKIYDPSTDELRLAGGQSSDDDIGDLILSIRDKHLLYGENSLLKIYCPLIESLCTRINDNSELIISPLTKTWAIVALSKFMCVSFEYCESNLPLLLSLLRKSISQTDRANISIALGDLSICFNRLIGENLGYMYQQLTIDSNIRVRKTMLMVLTHLILNGMLKIKSHLGLLAICLEDDDNEISQLTKLFFQELSSKNDNIIYNNIPDIISTLSFGANKDPIEQSKFDKIVKFLFQFIKDKQVDNIVEKLCLRFRSVLIPRQALDLSFCLSLLPYKSDKSIYKLISLMPVYSQFLIETNVYKLFSEIVTKIKHVLPSVNSGETAPAISPTVASEFESKLEHARNRAIGKNEDNMDVDKNDEQMDDKSDFNQDYEPEMQDIGEDSC